MPKKPSSIALSALLAAAVWAGTAIDGPRVDGHSITTNVTYQKDIAGILERRCTSCHRTGGFGPMSLETFEDARHWAPQIRDEVLSGRMPPWPAADGYADYLNSRRVSPIEMDLIGAWTSGGTPRGDDARLMRQSEAQSASTSDVMTIALRQTAATSLTATAETSAPRWITGWRFVPASGDTARRATVRVNGRLLGVWVPPEGMERLSSGVTLPLHNGDAIDVELDLGRAVTPAEGGRRLELTFGPRGVAPAYRDYPCGTHRVDAPLHVLEVMPLAAHDGDAIEALARTADGRTIPFVVVPSFRVGYQPSYRLRRPATIPAGSTLSIRSDAGDCRAGILFTSRLPDPEPAPAR
jgi:hypothetical protein